MVIQNRSSVRRLLRFARFAFARFAFAFVFAFASAPSIAHADEPAPPPDPGKPPAPVPAVPSVPRVHHAPRSVAPPNEPLEITATIDEPEHVKGATVLYKTSAGIGAAPFLRSSRPDAPYVATIPADAIRAPGAAYAIEIETTDGKRIDAFATRDEMQPILVAPDAADERERALLARFGGRRTTLATSADYVRFGASPATIGGVPTQVTDQYWEAQGELTYRVLRTVAEFGLRAGVLRGTSPVSSAKDPSELDVGLNYGAARIRLRLADPLHVEGELLSSVTEVGYSVGGGGAILIGDAYGTKLTLGFEGIQVFGVRGYSKFDVALSRRLVAATSVEVTNMPHAAAAAVRLAAEIRIDLGSGFGVGVRGGYQARSFASGGPSAGLTAMYSF